MMESIDYAIKMSALLGDLSECGDLGYVKEYDQKCFICLIDILGHGRKARSLAIKAEEYLEAHYQNHLVDVMQGLHQYLHGSRGGVVLMCRLDIPSGKLIYTGIGNITGRIIGINQNRMLSKDGILGFGNINPVISECQLTQRDLLLLHSDGIAEHFNTFDYLQLFAGDAESIAKAVLYELGKKTDDASCIALKYLK
ncbi:MAG: SpoIIE family protein phosphatase [Firmicutes bacterium]|nr:SpoIIE family protein phosphatase [Bacillota bacterium]